MKTYSNTGKLDPDAHFTSFGPEENPHFTGPVPEHDPDETVEVPNDAEPHVEHLPAEPGG